MKETEPEAKLKIQAVIVLYKIRLQDSTAFHSLRAAEEHAPDVELRTLLYDNSPDPGPIPDLPPSWSYERAPANLGVSGAYNRALAIAAAEAFDWLLTLDYDASLPRDFLSKIGAVAMRWRSDPSVAAIVPHLSSGTIPLSPLYVRPLRPIAVKPGFVGFAKGESYALNSGALLRVISIRDLGGFPLDFWLDQLDLWIHHHLYRAGRRTFVAGDIQLEHKLSLLDYQTLSLDHYRNFLQAESAFSDLYRGCFENLLLTAKLFCRWVKQTMRRAPHPIRRETWLTLQRRVLLTRSARIARWKAAARTRLVS